MEPSPELREIISGWFEAVGKGDTTWPDQYTSRQPGVRLVGTDPGEWLEGEKVAEFLTEEVKAMGGVVKVSVGDVEAYREGSVGWGGARPTITMPDGHQISPRWTAVFHQEDGQWRMVHLHASVGIPNEELLGSEAGKE